MKPSKQKSLEIDYILQKAQNYTQKTNQITSEPHNRVHLMRAIFIAIDLTQSMHIRDIKPSRLAFTIDMMRRLIKSMRDITPICKFMLAKVQNQLCKPLGNFGFGQNVINQLDGLKVIHNPGYFSLQNTLTVAMEYFDTIPSTYHKQLIIIQSSPFTKDYQDIYQTIALFKQSRISISIGSLVGWTFVYQKLVEACHGRYITISSQKDYEDFIEILAKNPIYNQQKVIKKLVKFSLSKRQYAHEKKMCFCHFKQIQEYFICGNCSAVLCERMPNQCAICMAVLVFPSDLYRYKN